MNAVVNYFGYRQLPKNDLSSRFAGTLADWNIMEKNVLCNSSQVQPIALFTQRGCSIVTSS